MDFEKFTKIMMLAQSPVDGEALAALRAATAALARAGMNWEQFLKQGQERARGSYASKEAAPSTEWRKNYKGNFNKRISDEYVTVFRNKSGNWTWVFKGEFSDNFEESEDAMRSFDEEWDL